MRPAALRELALIDLRHGRIALARDRLRAAVEVAPYDAEVRSDYARALRLAGDEVRAAEERAAAERLRKEKARIDDIQRRLATTPDDADLRSEVAKWLVENGHEKEGLQWTDLILRQRPGHPPTCRLLAEFHAKKGNVGLANYYRTAAPQRPGSPSR
jgi:Flp pilus assembly protein TadD